MSEKLSVRLWNYGDAELARMAWALEARIEVLDKDIAEWEAAAQYALDHYPEDIFPVEGTSQDAKAGTFARRLMGWLLDPAERKKWAALAAKPGG